MMAAGVRRALPSVRSLEVGYGDVQVAVTSFKQVVVSATFSRESVVESTGAASKTQGAVSWVWRNIDGQWLIIHGHISHPLTAGA